MHDYPIRPVPFTDVHFSDAFWAPRLEINRTKTVPFALEQCETSGRVDLLRRAAAALQGDPNVDRTQPTYPFDDSDIYKVIEGAAYTLALHPDPALETKVDAIADLVAQAQEPDGYLYPVRTIDPEHPHAWSGKGRWEKERTLSHELYNVGHLYEGAVAYAQATGKTTLLEVSLRNAALLVSEFGPERKTIFPGHQVTEIGLVKLHRMLGRLAPGSSSLGEGDNTVPGAETRASVAAADMSTSDLSLPTSDTTDYLTLAQFLIDARGPDGEEGSGNPYNQSHLPVLEQSEAVGHAVRATYLYAGMADVAAVLGDERYVAPLDRIWQDVVGKKLHLHGGIGATHNGEAFGAAYELPNDTAYCETCAAIGLAFWAQRMFLLHGDGQFFDVLERALYNGLLSGVSLGGMQFFYDNPLESDGWLSRRPWFGCACCPGNFARFLPSLPGYVYAQRTVDVTGNPAASVYVNLYIGGDTSLTLASGIGLTLAQTTNYPWDGKVEIAVAPAVPTAFALRLRLPGWARGEAVPSDLYRFADASGDPIAIEVNGDAVAYTVEQGYAVIEREWHAGDVVTLHLPMPIRRVYAHPRVEADRDRVALQRGPVVYAVEWADNPGLPVRSLLLPEEAPLAARFDPNLLGGVVVIEGEARLPHPDRTQVTTTSFTAIPYYAWANRGEGEMIVWLRNRSAGNH